MSRQRAEAQEDPGHDRSSRPGQLHGHPEKERDGEEGATHVTMNGETPPTRRNPAATSIARPVSSDGRGATTMSRGSAPFRTVRKDLPRADVVQCRRSGDSLAHPFVEFAAFGGLKLGARGAGRAEVRTHGHRDVLPMAPGQIGHVERRPAGGGVEKQQDAGHEGDEDRASELGSCVNQSTTQPSRSLMMRLP